MPQGSTMCPPEAALRVPPGLAAEIRRRTGVEVTFYRPEGTGFVEEGGDEAGADAAAHPLVIEAARRREECFEAGAGEARLAWPMHRRSRLVGVALARMSDPAAEGEGLGRRLLAAVADLVRTRLAGAVAADEREEVTDALSQCYEEISLLHNLGEVLRVNRPAAAFLEDVCGQLRETIGAEAVAAWIPPVPGVEPLTVVAGRLPLAAADMPALAECMLAGLDPQDAVLINNHVPDDPAVARFSAALERLVLAPVPVGKGAWGALAALNRRPAEFGSPEAKLVRSGASASAVFIDNRRLYVELQQMMLDLVRVLVSSVDAKDPYTCGHSTRVAITCHEVARGLGFADEQVQLAYMAGLLHDIGKIGTPEAILRKPGKLPPEERRIMCHHPVIGGQILRGIRSLESIREAVIHHHERVDGRGYPSGLKGDAIPLLARIIALADAFDAMTSNRPYRPRLPLEAVRSEIQRHAGTQFDPQVVAAMFTLDLDQLTKRFAEASTAIGTIEIRGPLCQPRPTPTEV